MEIHEFILSAGVKGNGVPNLPRALYKTNKFSKSNYHKLPAPLQKRVLFIDGGNAELLSAPDISIHFVRLVGVFFKGKERLESSVYEFYVGIKAFGFEEIKFEARLFPIKRYPAFFKLLPRSLVFDSYDKSLRIGNNRVPISKIGEVVRRLSEILLGAALGEWCDLVVLDGNLEPHYSYEGVFLDRLYSNVEHVIGFAKTSSMLMNGGQSVLSFLALHEPFAAWWYHPIAVGKHFEIAGVKLHPVSKHVFRVDIHGNPEEIIAALIPLCSDAAIPGYPYGLYYADKIARVSNTELKYLKSKLMVSLPKGVLLSSRALNFHDILNH